MSKTGRCLRKLCAQSRDAALDGSDHGAVLILDRLECMFPPLTSHTQVRVLVAPLTYRVTTWFAAS
jgi:hypothetical protein